MKRLAFRIFIAACLLVLASLSMPHLGGFFFSGGWVLCMAGSLTWGIYGLRRKQWSGLGFLFLGIGLLALLLFAASTARSHG